MKTVVAIAIVLFFGVVEATEFEAMLQWAKERTAQAELTFKGVRSPSPTFWPDNVVYFIFVDRFNNGNLSNDAFNKPPEQVHADQNNASWDLWSWRHGGDIQGITDRLDYLADLGIGTLWISPFLGHDGSYHGYCTQDPTKVDPGFGTEEEVVTMVSEAHKRGMKIIMDIAANHMCTRDTHYSTYPKDHENCTYDLNSTYWAGNGNQPSTNQGVLNFSSTFFKPFTKQEYFSRCGADTYEQMISETPLAVFGDFTTSMFDYDTRNPEFQQLYTEFMKYWIAKADIDGFRIDAAKHVTEDFLAYFSVNVRDYATKLGKDNVYIIGEIVSSEDWIRRRTGNMFVQPENPDVRYGSVSDTLVKTLKQLKSLYMANAKAPYPGVTAVYDMYLCYTVKDVMRGYSATSNVLPYWTSTYHHAIELANDYRLSWTMLEQHDWSRYIQDHGKDVDMAALGLSYVLTGPETPIIYYGQEQGFNGNCAPGSIHSGGDYDGTIQDVCNSHTDDSFKRQDMFIGGPWRMDAAVSPAADLAWIGRVTPVPSPEWKKDPMLDRNNVIYKTAKKMLRLRNSCGALRAGAFQVVYSEVDPGGLIVYSRNDGYNEIIVVLNTGTSIRNLTNVVVPIDKKLTPMVGTRFVNSLLNYQVGVSGLEEGMYVLVVKDLLVEPRGTLVFVRESNLHDFDTDIGVSLCKE